MKNTEDPLVSVVVGTYNSSKYVLETLESAKAQTYQDVELIISDDCSTDNSVEICRKWLVDNKERFVRVELLTVEKNTGVAANANRTLKASKGEWIKYIAADDILLPDCIENNIKFVHQSSENISFLFSRCKFLVGHEFDDNHPRVKYYNEHEEEYKKSARGQFLSLVKELFACPPTVLIKRNALIKLDGFDESFYETDDYPLLLKATSNGIKLHFHPIETVIYRFHDLSLSEQYYKKWVYIDEKMIKKYFKIKYRILYPFHYLDFRLNYFNKKRVIEGKTSYGKLTKLINPLAIIHFIKIRLKNYKLKTYT